MPMALVMAFSNKNQVTRLEDNSPALVNKDFELTPAAHTTYSQVEQYS